MVIGCMFQELFQKVLCFLEIGRVGFGGDCWEKVFSLE